MFSRRYAADERTVRRKGKQIMKVPTKALGVENINACRPVTIYTVRLVIYLVVLLLTFRAEQAQAEWPYVVPSKDGTPISYEIYGTGEPNR